MTESNRPPLVLPALIVIVGVGLLLINFLIVEGVELGRYWPVLIIGIGLLVLVRGDLGLTWQAQTFGITRGNVQTAQLEASAGELDVKIQALQREARLIAGSYTARSRPVLGVRGTHARLTMQRGQTWLLSLADWEIGLAQDLPWGLLVSTHLGEIEADLTGITLDRAHFGTGLGNIRLVAPEFCREGIQARSAFGDIVLEVPENTEAVVTIQSNRLSRLHVDETRYLMIAPGVYATLGYQAVTTPIPILLKTTFGTIKLG
jgi:hypothetical protein